MGGFHPAHAQKTKYEKLYTCDFTSKATNGRVISMN